MLKITSGKQNVKSFIQTLYSSSCLGLHFRKIQAHPSTVLLITWILKFHAQVALLLKYWKSRILPKTK